MINELQPGIYPNISNEKYHAADGVSKSGITKFRKAPVFYRAYKEEKLKNTDALRIGRMTHTFILEPEKFNQNAVFDGPRRVGAAWNDFYAEHGEEYLLKKEVSKIESMSKQVYAHTTAASLLLAKGQVEVSAIWEDSYTGITCKTRPDKIVNNMFIDYKTVADSSPRKFSSAVFEYGYHIQAAMARDGFKANGVELDTFIFITQEKEPPFNVEVYFLSKEALKKGEEEYLLTLRSLAKCAEENIWPGYNNFQAVEIDLPYYAYKEDL